MTGGNRERREKEREIVKRDTDDLLLALKPCCSCHHITQRQAHLLYPVAATWTWQRLSDILDDAPQYTHAHTQFSLKTCGVASAGGKTSDFSVSPIRLSSLEQGAETFGADNSGKASQKQACHDFTGFYGEIQHTRTSFGRCILAERRSQHPETVKFITDPWRRHVTLVCSKQAIHLTVAAFRVQSNRTSTGVIIWSLICRPVSSLVL